MLVLGAQGVLGGMCVDALRATGLDVVRAGRRPDGADDFRLVDLDDARSVAEGCAGFDLVVSTVRHPGHPAERLILREGGALLSVATLWAAEREDLRHHPCATGGLVVLDAGLAPGVSSLVLKELLEEHPDADELEGAGTFSAVEPSGAATAVDFLLPAFRHARRNPTRVLDFPGPIGRRRCLLLPGPDVEAMIFGELPAGRSTRFYGCMVERPVNAELLALNAIGLLRRVPAGMLAMGGAWKLRHRKAKPQAHLVAVDRGGRRLGTNVVECSGNYRTTAAALAVFSQAVLRRRRDGPALSGVHGVEGIFDLAELRAGFEAHGIRIRSLPS